MTIDEWMVKGYTDFGSGVCAPPNEPAAHDAYLHGWLNAQDDKNQRPRATAEELRQRAANIKTQETDWGDPVGKEVW